MLYALTYDIQIPADTLKYQGCPEEPKLAILAHCAPPPGRYRVKLMQIWSERNTNDDELSALTDRENGLQSTNPNFLVRYGNVRKDHIGILNCKDDFRYLRLPLCTVQPCITKLSLLRHHFHQLQSLSGIVLYLLSFLNIP